MDNEDRVAVGRTAARMARAESIWEAIVLQGRSATIRELAKQHGVSTSTVLRDLEIYRQFLAKRLGDTKVDERRAELIDLVRDVIARAQRDASDAKTPSQVRAMLYGQIINAVARLSALMGADMPKASKVEGEVSYTVRWMDEEEATRDAVTPNNGDTNRPVLHA